MGGGESGAAPRGSCGRDLVGVWSFCLEKPSQCWIFWGGSAGVPAPGWAGGEDPAPVVCSRSLVQIVAYLLHLFGRNGLLEHGSMHGVVLFWFVFVQLSSYLPCLLLAFSIVCTGFVLDVRDEGIPSLPSHNSCRTLPLPPLPHGCPARRLFCGVVAGGHSGVLSNGVGC